MAGSIILAGGHEVRPGCELMDRRVIDRAGGTGARVVFLPTAVAAHDPYGSILGAIAYYSTLGVRAEGVPVLSRADADRSDFAETVRGAALVYLGGGDPAFLLETLRGTAVWHAILDVYAAGGVVGGSSAGAMVLCDWLAAPPTWQPQPLGLGLVQRALVVPHWSPDRGGRLRERSAAVPDGTAVLGVPEQSGLLGSGSTWEVVGPGPVILSLGDAVTTHATGEVVRW